MKTRLTLCLVGLAAGLVSGWTPGQAAALQPDPEPDAGAVVCPPDVYPLAPDDCLPLGPSQFLTDAAREGVPYPILPLPAYPPDPALGNVPYMYFRVEETGTPVFASLPAAINGGGAGLFIGPGDIMYVSYTERAEAEGGIYYMRRAGGWIRGDGSRVGLPYPFQGLLFSSTPANAFGWVLERTASRLAPGYRAPESETVYTRFQVVQVFEVRQADGADWVRIAPGEWIEDRLVAVVHPDPNPPPGVPANRWISIDLYQQTLSVYEDNELIFATMISSGIEPFWTQPGTFQIYEKKDVETMQGSFEADRSDYYYLEDVPWTMYFDQKRALHGAYWHSFFGYPRSHGCVNLSLGDSHWLYDWAEVGDWVYVFDPSGQTPTDPALYGSGAP